MNTILKGLTLTEILDSATLSERMAAEYFDHLAAWARDDGNTAVAGFFVDQANRERGHCNQLAHYREKHGLREYREPQDELPWISPEAAGWHKDDQDRQFDLDTALTVVEQNEAKAERFYREAAQEVDDPDLQGLFTRLADEEAAHRRHALAERGRKERLEDMALPDYEDLGYGT